MKLKIKKRIDYRYYIYFAIFAVCVALAIFVYNTSYVRLWQSLVNLCTATAYYFVEVFKINATVNTKITELISIDLSKFLPFPMDEMLYKLKALFPSLFTWEYFKSYFVYVLYWVQILIMFSPLLILFLFLFGKLITSSYLKNVDKKGRSKALNFFLFRVRPKLNRIKEWILDFVDFGRSKHILKILAVLWLLNLNILSIAVAALAFYLYFVASFSVPALLVNIVNLLADLIIMFGGLPLIAWLVIGYIVLDKVRKFLARNKLNHNEAKNKGFIKGVLSLVNLIVGFMRSGKNLLETDIALSAEMIHRDMALEGMTDAWHKFPDFPWRNLEHEVERALLFKQITNLPEARVFAQKKRNRFFKNMCNEKIFGYEYEIFAYEFDNGMYIENIFDVVETYVQFYSMYCVKTSLIVSNYAVRSGAIRDDLGHFPVWKDDFFESPSFREICTEQMSHIINYDQFRLGKRVETDGEDIGIFGYGVALMSEKGKERGNAIENQSYKKDDYKANPKNDYFNMFLKVIAHGATVDYKHFLLVLGDEQRPESVGADEREVSTLLHICGREENVLAMPFFEFEIVIYNLLRSKFDPFYVEYRKNRSDGTLLVYMLHHIVSAFFGYYKRTYGKYGYDIVDVGVEKGTMDGNVEMHKYYISHHKTRAKRFPTDCYRNMLAERSLKAHKGLTDLPTYRDVRGDDDEMDLQRSYFVNEFKKHIRN